MPLLRKLTFGGELPLIGRRLLPPNAAQIAQNVNLLSGEIRPFYDPLSVNKPAKAGTKKTIFRWAPTVGADAKGAIQGATQTNPVRITSANHGRTTGQRLYITGVAGMTQINDITHTITVIDANTFDLNGVNGIAYGAYTGGGTWIVENGYWFHWLTEVDVVRSPVAGNATERVYYTGDGVPKVTDSSIALTGGTQYPMQSYTLGLPKPAVVPTVEAIRVGKQSNADPTYGQIVSATNANPVVLTMLGPVQGVPMHPRWVHGLTTGDVIVVTGAVGMTELNTVQTKTYPPAWTKMFKVVIASATTFELHNMDDTPVNGTAWGVYTGGGVVSRLEQGDLGEIPNDVKFRVYTYTYVTAWGEEGPPSDPSEIVAVAEGQPVKLTAMSTGPGGSYNATAKRIYRVLTGSDAVNADYQFVAEIAVATAEYLDEVPDVDLGEVIPSKMWLAPPTGLKGLKSMPNGILIGHTENEICPCEPFLPHAWPVAYRQSTNHRIVGIGVFGLSAVIGTEGFPYIISGSSPASMSMQKIDSLEQACVSARGIIGVGDLGVMYPSPDGLVLVSAGVAKVITALFLSREQWQAYRPESIIACSYEGRYVAFYANGTTSGGFVFDPAHPAIGLVHIDVSATAVYVDLISDALYLQVGDVIQRWDYAATKKTYTWRSRPDDFGRPVNLSCAQVIAETYSNLTARVYADGVLKHTQVVASRNPFRLPAGFLAHEWFVEVEGTDNVKEILAATSMAELGAV